MKRALRLLPLVLVLGLLVAASLFCQQNFLIYSRDDEYEPAWSPDGSKIAFIGETEGGAHLYVMDADGSNIVRLVDLGGVLLSRNFPGPTWSPDGERIAYTTDINRRDEIWLINIDGSEAKPLIDDETQHQSNPIWSPDGNLIAYNCNYREVEDSNSDNICLVNVNDLKVKRLTYFSDNSSMYDFSWHADGDQIAFRKVAADQSKSEYYVMNRDGSNLTLLPFFQPEDQGAVWSPAGTRIAFTQIGFLSMSQGLFVMHSDGSHVVRLTDWMVYNPNWSPDGRKLAFSVYVSHDSKEIFVLNADGSGPHQLTGTSRFCDLYILTHSFC